MTDMLMIRERVAISGVFVSDGQLRCRLSLTAQLCCLVIGYGLVWSRDVGAGVRGSAPSMYRCLRIFVSPCPPVEVCASC